jgi:hypothetical protein
MHMKKLSLLLTALLIAGCSEAAKPPRNADMEGAGARIVIGSGDSIPGHSQYVTLGQVRARCMKNREASYISAEDVIADGNLQRAAYRTYGSQVDAIVGANVLYVSHPTLVNPLFDAEGHLECEGTAIHFTGEPAGESTARSH